MKKEDQCTWRDCEFITPRTKKKLRVSPNNFNFSLALLRVERTTDDDGDNREGGAERRRLHDDAIGL